MNNSLCLPSNEILLIEGATGKKESVMLTDLRNMEDFKDELKYLFEKCGYDINKYIEAIYVNGNGNITMRILLEDLYD